MLLYLMMNVGFGVEVETDPTGMVIVCVLLHPLDSPSTYRYTCPSRGDPSQYKPYNLGGSIFKKTTLY